MVIFYQNWKKYKEIQLTKNKTDKHSKNDKSSTLPRVLIFLKLFRANLI